VNLFTGFDRMSGRSSSGDDRGLLRDGDMDSSTDERAEQSFDVEAGAYRATDGRFRDGAAPADYDREIRGFRAADGTIKDGSADLGDDTPMDADGGLDRGLSQLDPDGQLGAGFDSGLREGRGDSDKATRFDY
jgi:hypothetical protein